MRWEMAGEWCDPRSNGASDMHFDPRSLRRVMRIAAAGLVALGCTAAAHADLLFLNDGFVLEGQIKRDFELLVEKGEGVHSPKRPFYLEDGPRRVNFSATHIRIIDTLDPHNDER